MITSTLVFLPLLFGPGPAMAGTQPIQVVWVDTSRDRWRDTSAPRAALGEALTWWEARVGVSFAVTERTLTIDADPYTMDICEDRSWAPQGRALYFVAWEQTGRVFYCGVTPVADWTDTRGAYLWGGIRADELAHALGHYFGARDSATEDIMDFRFMQASYERGYVAAETLRALGATGAAPSGAGARAAHGAGSRVARRWQAPTRGGSRLEDMPYLIERSERRF